MDLDLEFIVIGKLQLVHIIVIMRLAISMIFIIGLAKWFSRTYFHLIMVTTIYIYIRLGFLVHE